MTQYPKIFIPAGSPVPANARTIDGKFFEPKEGMVVMTVEELQKLWNDSNENGRNAIRPFPSGPQIDFETYLRQNGIEIK